MYHVSAQGVDERMQNVHYYYSSSSSSSSWVPLLIDCLLCVHILHRKRKHNVRPSHLNYPAPEATSCTVYPPLTWVSLGSPSRMFGFSEDERTFMEARDACRAQPGKVRLAVLDTLFAEVKEWVEGNQLKRDYWIDATRPPNSGKFQILCL